MCCAGPQRHYGILSATHKEGDKGGERVHEGGGDVWRGVSTSGFRARLGTAHIVLGAGLRGSKDDGVAPVDSGASIAPNEATAISTPSDAKSQVTSVVSG